jgi:hypothetical protein
MRAKRGVACSLARLRPPRYRVPSNQCPRPYFTKTQNPSVCNTWKFLENREIPSFAHAIPGNSGNFLEIPGSSLLTELN